MKQPKKKCKGINKAQGFKGCGTETYYRKYGLCPSCLSDWFATETGKVFFEKLTLKASKPRRELEKAEKELKETNKLGTLLKNVQNVCHKYIRLRDRYKPCISCGEAWNDTHQAGHFYKAELFSSLKFNEYNINGQCVGCNIPKDGNESQYRVNLPNRIGIENYRELEHLASLEKQTDHKWERSKLIEIRDYYKQKLKQLTQ
jgi:hypothetical protein